ncbi:hypothetical protein ACJJIE_05695 [Microbulbifer sp. TRSA001]|uniref:hypothetical protein n=1 Tax=Microbulbifer sp. TRSA001 TaxID=3243381 RepID=UPI00403A5B66
MPGSERVYQLTMVTCHNYTPTQIAEKLLVDVDLAILGASKEAYDGYETQVRKEYRLVPSIVYKKK